MAWRLAAARAPPDGDHRPSYPATEPEPVPQVVENAPPQSRAWPGRCCGQETADGEDLDDEAVARLAALRETFWGARERDQQACWVVPMGRDLDAMPWLRRDECGLLEAMARARRRLRRVPLLVDNTLHRVVDTFFQYRAVQVIEAKAMVLDERTRRRSRAQAVDDARRRLVNAMRLGQTLLVRLSNVAWQFLDRYASNDSLPLAMFDQPRIDECIARFGSGSGQNLFGSDHPLARCLREADTDDGFFAVRPTFEVVLSTQFARDEFARHLSRALPWDALQPILPKVTPEMDAPPPAAAAAPSASGAKAGDAADADADADAGGSATAVYTLEDAHAAAIRIAARVEQMRERRASGGARAGSSTFHGVGAEVEEAPVPARPWRVAPEQRLPQHADGASGRTECDMGGSPTPERVVCVAKFAAGRLDRD